MAYEIHLRKPEGREALDNRVWFDALRSACSCFVEDEYDREQMATLSEEASGITKAEYLARGIGLRLSGELEGIWVNVDFGTDVATLELPNFPTCGIAHACAQLRPVFHALATLGFVPLDPTSGEPWPSDFDAQFTADYLRRQETVSRVAELTRGRVT